MWGLIAGAVAEAHRAHAAAPHDAAGSARGFHGEAVLPTNRALNGPGALRPLRTMQRVVNALLPGLEDPKATLNGYWMELRTPIQSGGPLSIGDRCG